MPQQTHGTLSPLSSQLQALIQQGWEQKVLCQLPADYEQQARTTRAFVRAKGLKSVADLLRGLLAYVLCAPSFRQSLSLGRAQWPGEPVARGLAEAFAHSPQLPAVAPDRAARRGCPAQGGCSSADRAHGCGPTQRTWWQWRRLARASGL